MSLESLTTAARRPCEVHASKCLQFTTVVSISVIRHAACVSFVRLLCGVTATAHRTTKVHITTCLQQLLGDLAQSGPTKLAQFSGFDICRRNFSDTIFVGRQPKEVRLQAFVNNNHNILCTQVGVSKTLEWIPQSRQYFFFYKGLTIVPSNCLPSGCGVYSGFAIFWY